MKTMTVAEFQALTARDDWKREQDHDVVHEGERQVPVQDEDGEGNPVCTVQGVVHAFGSASLTSTLDGITITYNEGFNYDKFNSGSLSVGTEGQDEVWTIAGVVVVDDDGDTLSAHDLGWDLPGEFKAIDYSVLRIEEVTNLDVSEESNMETITIEVDNAPSIRFTGELIASASSSDDRAMGSSYSGQTGRWTTLRLYRTAGGALVCHQIGHTRWQGERTRYSAKVCSSMDEVREFFGHRWLAKELYEDGGIDDAVEVS